jgi:hypothetical protein
MDLSQKNIMLTTFINKKQNLARVRVNSIFHRNSMGGFWFLDIYKCPFLEMGWTFSGTFFEFKIA